MQKKSGLLRLLAACPMLRGGTLGQDLQRLVKLPLALGLTQELHLVDQNLARKPRFSKRLHRERNLVVHFFSKPKHFRRFTTRYDKLAANFLAMIQLASMRLWLQADGSTANLAAI